MSKNTIEFLEILNKMYEYYNLKIFDIHDDSVLLYLYVSTYDNYPAYMESHVREWTNRLNTQYNIEIQRYLNIEKNIQMANILYEKVSNEHERLYRFFNRVNDKVPSVADENFSPDKLLSLSKYLCTIPDNYILTSIPDHNTDIDTIMSEYCRYKKLIDNKISTLFPIYRDNEHGRYTRGHADKLLYISAHSLDSDEVNSFDFIDNIYIELPWLYDLRLDDQIEVVNKYPLEYEHLARKIKLIATSCETFEQFSNILNDEIKDAIINIKINYEKEQAKLKTKGIVTVLGMALTIIPVVFPDVPKEFSTLFGGVSIFKATEMLNDYVSLNRASRENPFWTIWKMNN